jgi:hypothetical protein
MKFKIGDQVTRKWKPHFGKGTITHILGDKIVVTWYGTEMPRIEFEEIKNLKVTNESGRSG